jgi:hypothetical protein
MPGARPPESAAKRRDKIKKDVQKLQRAAERKGWNFTTPTDDELTEKLRRAKSPMIVFQGWSSSAPPGGSISYQVGINNPDPTDWIWLFVHLFIGPGNMVRNTGAALATVDERFPRLTLPEFDGLQIASGATESLDFQISVPVGVEATNYLGNSFLFQSTWHDPGEYIDRSLFVFQVT